MKYFLKICKIGKQLDIDFRQNCNYYFLSLCREKEKLREREEAWQHIEDLAVQNPLFDKFSSESNDLYSSSFITSPQDDNDSDFSSYSIGGESTEVSSNTGAMPALRYFQY